MKTIEYPMSDVSPEKLIGAIGAGLGGLLAGLKIWKVYAPKVRAWQERRANRKHFLDSGFAKLEELIERQSRIELTMSFAHSVGEMTLMLAGVAAWKSNLNGEATFIAPALAELLGMDQTSARGWGWLTAVHSDDRQPVGTEYRAAVLERRAFSAWYRYRQESGEILYVHGVAYPAINPATGLVQEYWGRAKQIGKEEWMKKRNE